MEWDQILCSENLEEKVVQATAECPRQTAHAKALGWDRLVCVAGVLGRGSAWGWRVGMVGFGHGSQYGRRLGRQEVSSCF